MRTYETIYIVHPDVVGDGYTAVVDKFKGVLTDQGGNVVKVDEWGTRKLAYPVKKQGRGTYVLMAYEAGADMIAELERRMRLDDQVIKFQTLLLEEGLEEAAPAAEEGATGEEAEAAEASE